MFDYKWYLKDGYPAKNGLKCFDTFICGGGSSMGYKLAGIDHLGGVEIDPTIARIYKKNHNPKYLYTMDIRDFVKMDNLPDELFGIDILDGSPPCSTFSMAGSREDAWGKEKQFAEGQKLQTLDDLFFFYLDLVEKIRPKVFIAENVSGLLKGNAKAYVRKILDRANAIGYETQLFLLNGQQCGLPQKRERCFFVGRRKDLHLPRIQLKLMPKKIPFSEIKEKGAAGVSNITPELMAILREVRVGRDFDVADVKIHLGQKGGRFSERIVYDGDVVPTLTAQASAVNYVSPDKKEIRRLSRNEILMASSFPLDYDDMGKLCFLTGMSVPPIMTATLAEQVCKQVFGV